MLNVFYDCYVICYLALSECNMILKTLFDLLKTLFDLLEGVRTWKLLKGGVEKAKVRKVKKGRRPYCPFVNAEKYFAKERKLCERR